MAGIETMIIGLRESGFPLILLWLLTLAIVYGILAHVKIPASQTARGVIALVSAFMVLLAAAATPVTAFISNIVTSFIMIAFGLLIAVIFLEMVGVKIGEKNIFAGHPKFFGAAILIIAIMVFIGAGGLNLLGWRFSVTDTSLGIIFFLGIMVAAMWMLMKEKKD